MPRPNLLVIVTDQQRAPMHWPGEPGWLDALAPADADDRPELVGLMNLEGRESSERLRPRGACGPCPVVPSTSSSPTAPPRRSPCRLWHANSTRPIRSIPSSARRTSTWVLEVLLAGLRLDGEGRWAPPGTADAASLRSQPARGCRLRAYGVRVRWPVGSSGASGQMPGPRFGHGRHEGLPSGARPFIGRRGTVAVPASCAASSRTLGSTAGAAGGAIAGDSMGARSRRAPARASGENP